MSERARFWLTVTVVVLVPTFLGLGYWQLQRALSGNLLSWAYTFEWPFFAVYAVAVWWRLVRGKKEQREAPRPASSPPSSGAEAAPLHEEREEEEDEELRAYNEYLRWLASQKSVRGR